MSDLPTVPVTLRVHLAHATVQAIADSAGADILHLKGPALDPALGASRPPSTDADVLVRPSHVKRLFAGLKEYGWHQVLPLRAGGVAQHSANWYHGQLGQLDIHVRFPGIQRAPGDAFDLLWQVRRVVEIAGRPCLVPGLDAQRLVLLLHAARAIPQHAGDVAIAWTDASATERHSLQNLARELDAEVALAAATGRLEEYRDRPEYEYWRIHADGADAAGKLKRTHAAIKAVPRGYRLPRLRILAHELISPLRVRRRLSIELRRRPTLQEVARGYAALVRRGAAPLRRRRSK